MLTINSQNDKLAAVQIDFLSHGMLSGTCLSKMLHALTGNTDDTNEDDIDKGAISDSDGDGLDLDANDDEDNHSEDSPYGPVDGPPIFGEVTLASKKGALHVHAVFLSALTCQ